MNPVRWWTAFLATWADIAYESSWALAWERVDATVIRLLEERDVEAESVRLHDEAYSRYVYGVAS